MVLLVACQKKPAVSEEPSSAIEETDEYGALQGLPDRMKISDKLGRSLEVKIIGRDSEKISFVRLSDSKVFEWKISQLAEADQEIIKKLPMIAAPSNSVVAVQDRLFLTNRKKDLARLKKEIAELQKELPALLESSSKGISPRAKGIERLIATKEEQVANLENDIKQYPNP